MAWRYRDYVIRSLNQDKHYDTFVKEQIAGDEMGGNRSERLVALGFLRMGTTGMTAQALGSGNAAEVAATLGRVGNVPVDIRPVFVTADEVAPREGR